MFLISCGPRSSKLTDSLCLICSNTLLETQMPPGCARPSSRAATLTPSPNRSSFLTMTSPTLMPMRNIVFRSSVSSALRLAISSWNEMAQRTASTVLPNSASTLSPPVLKTRPSCRSIKASMMSRYSPRILSVASSSARLHQQVRAIIRDGVAGSQFIFPWEGGRGCQMIGADDVRSGCAPW